MSTISFIVPLTDYEKHLIDDFVKVFDWKQAAADAEISLIVLRYKWTIVLREALEEIIQNPQWTEYHQGEWDIICECLERSMRMEINGDKFRFRAILAANACLSQVHFESGTKFDMKSYAEDCQYWRILTTLLRLYESSEPAIIEHPPFSLENATELDDKTVNQEPKIDQPGDVQDSSQAVQDSEGSIVPREELLSQLWEYHSSRRDFEVWSLIRACASILRRDENSIVMANEAITRTQFYEIHDAVHNGFVQNGKQRHGSNLASGTLRITPLGFQVLSFGDHPLKYIEFVPWKQLEACVVPKPSEHSHNKKFLRWKAPKLLNWEKHFFTEDGIFGTCVLSGYEFPNYSSGGEVIFATSPIEDFTLLSYKSYWKDWNDCVVTHNPGTNEWHLLQTLPGLHFRSLSKKVDERAAIRFFRVLVQNKIQGRSESLSDVLGLHFQPKYENLLDLIPYSQITKVDSKPLGEGKRGVVYRAVWSHQAGFGDETLVHHDVALKSIKIQGSSDVSRFMKELDSTFSAVSGANTVRIVQLHGIIRTPPHKTLPALSPCLYLPENQLLLVLDFAKYSSLKDYLLKTLRGTDEDWPILVGFMVNIINGLTRIHARNLVHRDIHWENVLVSVRYCTGDEGPVVESIEAAISDLGEGQHIGTQSQGRTYYGNPAFWAPEVRATHHHTAASDIWAIGCLFLGMVQLHWDVIKPKISGSTAREIQAWLLQIIFACLETNPKERLTARELAEEFDLFEFPTKDEEEEVKEARKLIAVEPEKLERTLEQRLTLREEGEIVV